MGQGGTLVLVNATNSVWTRTRVYAYQMEDWQNVFPYTISPGETKELYVEWQESWSPFFNSADDHGEVCYELADSNGSFEIEAIATNGFELRVKLHQIETHPLQTEHDDVVSLGWEHNGHVAFILAGEEKPYSATGMDASKWMSKHLDVLGEKPLYQISMPGSHNAGMSDIIASTLFVNSANTQTHSQNIEGQLRSGCRYFDVRPVISAARFATGHYSRLAAGEVTVHDDTKHLVETWQGGTGQTIADIIDNVNSFTAENPELVVLMLSHSYNTDVGNADYRPFNEDENERLLYELSRLNHLYTADPGTNLTELTLNDFLQDGTAAVVVILERGYSAPSSLEGRGFFDNKCFPVYDQYSNTDELNDMISDQIRKMENFQRPGRCFLLSWTLTLQGIDNITGASVEKLADEANEVLVHRAFRKVSDEALPSIVYLDYIRDSMPAVFCIAANWKVHLEL